MRGGVLIDIGITIPFEIKRVFYIYGTADDEIRGQHANRNIEFILINISGSSRIRTDDGRGNQQEFFLNRPDLGVYIPKMFWKEMYDFSTDSVLLCLSSEFYDSREYIRDYEEYIREFRESDK